MWLEVSVTADLAAVEALSALFEQHGEGGVAIDQPFYTDAEGERFGIDTARPATVKTYLPDTAEGQARLRRLREGLWHLSAFNLAAIGELSVRQVAEEDWANAWKEHYRPMQVGRLLIKPSWRAVEPAPDTVTVEIDPGMAFGTGIHQTTRMCLALLDKLMQSGWIVIDQGAGSGILAVAAAKLGAAEVWARDIAEVAVEATMANAERNGLRDRLHVHRVDAGADAPRQVLLDPSQPAADLIVANIIANVLIKLTPAFVAASRQGAFLIASGIIRERAAEVEGALRAAGYRITERLAEDEWVTLAARLDVSPSPVSS